MAPDAGGIHYVVSSLGICTTKMLHHLKQVCWWVWLYETIILVMHIPICIYIKLHLITPFNYHNITDTQQTQGRRLKTSNLVRKTHLSVQLLKKLNTAMTVHTVNTRQETAEQTCASVFIQLKTMLQDEKSKYTRIWVNAFYFFSFLINERTQLENLSSSALQYGKDTATSCTVILKE